MEARSCGAALEAARRGAVDILIADLILPDGMGTSVARRLQAVNPNLKVILTSGTPISAWGELVMHDVQSLAEGSWRWLAKPFPPRSVVELVRELLGVE